VKAPRRLPNGLADCEEAEGEVEPPPPRRRFVNCGAYSEARVARPPPTPPPEPPPPPGD